MLNQLTPEMQDELNYFNCPEIQASIWHFYSPEVQASIRHFYSPEVQESIRHFYSPEVQATLKMIRSTRLIELLKLQDSPKFQHRVAFLESPETISKTIRENEQYIPEDQVERYDKIIKPALESAPAKGLTIENIFMILTLLVTIFFGIMSSLPDEQKTKLIEQNARIIQNQQTIIAQNEKMTQNQETIIKQNERMIQNQETMIEQDVEEISELDVEFQQLTQCVELIAKHFDIFDADLERAERLADGEDMLGAENAKQQSGDSQG